MFKHVLCWFGNHDPFFGSVAPIQVNDALGGMLWRLDPCNRCRKLVVSWYYESPDWDGGEW